MSKKQEYLNKAGLVLLALAQSHLNHAQAMAMCSSDEAEDVIRYRERARALVSEAKLLREVEASNGLWAEIIPLGAKDLEDELLEALKAIEEMSKDE